MGRRVTKMVIETTRFDSDSRSFCHSHCTGHCIKVRGKSSCYTSYTLQQRCFNRIQHRSRVMFHVIKDFQTGTNASRLPCKLQPLQSIQKVQFQSSLISPLGDESSCFSSLLTFFRSQLISIMSCSNQLSTSLYF